MIISFPEKAHPKRPKKYRSLIFAQQKSKIEDSFPLVGLGGISFSEKKYLPSEKEQNERQDFAKQILLRKIHFAKCFMNMFFGKFDSE